MPLFTFGLLRRSMEQHKKTHGTPPGGGWGLIVFFALILLGLAALIGALAWWASSTAK